jgi:hypothetical protein
MMDDQDMGRNDHFADGATGLMQGTNPATATPLREGTPFAGSGVLQVPNIVKPVNGESDSSFLNSMMPALAKNSPFQRAQAGVAQDAGEIQPAGTSNQETAV